MINTQYINLNMIPSGVMPVLYCSQYDIGRPLGMVVYNGSESVDLDSYTCTIEATRTDGTAITAAVTTDGNIGAFVTTATMTNNVDHYPAKLVLFDSNSRRVASLAFVMVVTEKTMNENAESIQEDESLYQQFTGTVQALIADIRLQLTDLSDHVSDMYFDTCTEMKTSTTLKVGMVCQTAGYYAVNDGGGALYRIYSSAPSTYHETLSNGLYAALVSAENTVTVEMFGAVGDSTTNDTQAFNNAITYAKATKKHVICFGKTYSITGTVSCQSGVNLLGTTHYLNTTTIDFGGTGKFLLNALHDVTIRGFYFKNFNAAISFETARNYTIRIEKCTFSNGTTGVQVASATGYMWFEDCQFDMSTLTNGIILKNETADSVGINYVYIKNCRFDGGGGATTGTSVTVTGINIFIENCDFTNLLTPALNCNVAYIGGLFITNTCFWHVESVIDLTSATVGNYNFAFSTCRFHNLTSGLFKNNVSNTYTRDVIIETCIATQEIIIPQKVYIDALSYNIHGVTKSSSVTNYIEALRGSNIKNCRTTKFGVAAGASKTVTIDNKYNYFMSYDAVAFPPDGISIDNVTVTDDTVSITVTNNSDSQKSIFVEIH